MRADVRTVVPIALVLMASLATGLEASPWTSLTNVNTVRGMAFDPGTGEVVLASWGGLLLFRSDDEEIGMRGRVEGFSSVDLTGIAIDPEGRYFLATADRGMDIRFPDGAIRNYTELDGLPSDDVLAVTLNDGDIWVGTTGGAAQLRLEGEILQPRNLFFAEPMNLEVREIAFHGDTTAFATNEGLWLWCPTNCLGGNSFRQITTDDTLLTLLDNSVQALLYLPNGDLYVGTSSGVQRLSGAGNLTELNGGLSGSSLSINDILAWDGILWLATDGGIYSYNEALGRWESRTDDLGVSRALSLFLTPDNSLWAGTYQGGFAEREANGWRVWKLPGPSVNFLTNIAIDARGVVWTSTWKAASGGECGIGRYDGSTWVVYTESNSGLIYNYVSALSVAPDSTLWAGSPWYDNPAGESGVSVIDDAGTSDLGDDTWWTFPAATSGLSGDAIRTEVVFNGRDHAWIGSWEQFNNFGLRGGLDLLEDYRGEAGFRSFIDYLRDDQVNALTLDRQGNLWIGYKEVGVDVFILHPESGTDSLLLQADPDGFYLLSGAIHDLKVGPENHLWIGSASGLNEVDFRSNPADRSGYIWRSFTRENTGGGIPDLLVRDIEFQGSRYVWLATPSGVSRYDRVNGEWEVFDEGNSGLIDNRVWDIAVDNDRNQIWFATEKGISRYDPLGDISPVEVSGEMTIYPNPFTPEQGHTAITMGPFRSPARLTLYTLAGRKIMSLGGEEEWVRWDGKDASGRALPSGVYIVVSQSEDGSGARGKIAIIR